MLSNWTNSVGGWIKGAKAAVPAPVVPSVPATSSSSNGSDAARIAARLAVGALAVTGGVALLRAGWLRWGPALPFPSGRQSRREDSTPFGAVQPDESVRHHFYGLDQVKFINLSQGRVRYILRGPSSSSSSSSTAASSSSDSESEGPGAAAAAGGVQSRGPVVVLVHGFSIAADIWKQVADHLVAQGHTVLSFDNYGRGWSDAPDVLYDERLYIGQLAELLFALNIRAPIDLVGVSMGGAIVTCFAAAYPSKVNRLCMVCPAGLPLGGGGSSKTFGGPVTWPLVGGMLFKSLVPTMQARGAAAQWEEGSDGPTYRAWGAFGMRNVAEHPGFVRTLHRTVLQFPMIDQRANFAVIAAANAEGGAKAQAPMDILIIWGERDGLTPYVNAPVLQSLLPGSQLVTIVQAKHNMLVERAQPIAETLAAWLEDSKAPLPKRVHTTLLDQQEGQ